MVQWIEKEQTNLSGSENKTDFIEASARRKGQGKIKCITKDVRVGTGEIGRLADTIELFLSPANTRFMAKRKPMADRISVW